ncbi:hypothetical protein ACSCB1_09775 [Streptomyces europaeiscabiei]|uniref:Secreted protein n=1 Tax=Streptomyces europaeiscabiei TaxID=146819 RepID=A0ABU4N719_9ACTN|nr:hypothetical protein [Streptomyces europaeiscabiei]MDX3541985.1 hypothetical protein [Streptomyces europaeiscabiei]MDX3551033.1 hypothetical protein [Streptomyces europaeiscabiei]MDX3698407.1 hypothetical protein [Streptomyces europaeiscabiei]
MRALVSRGLLLSPLVCGALVFGPVGTATAAVDVGRTSSDRTSMGTEAVPEADLDDFFDALDAEIDALLAKEEADVDALIAKEEADVDALIAQEEAEVEALLAKLDLELDGLLADIDADTATDADAAATDAEVLLDQLGLLDRMDQSDVLAPLLDELTTIAELDADRLDATEAARHVEALRAANTTVQQRLQKLEAAAPVTTGRATAAADPVADLPTTLQPAVDALIKALTSLDLGTVLGAVTGLLAPILEAVTGLLQPALGLVGGVVGVLPPTTLPALPAA